MQSYISNYDAILDSIRLYNQGLEAGSSAIMKPAFHPASTFFGYFKGQLLAGSTQMLFDWVDGNGPASAVRSSVASVDILDSVAIVRLEVENLDGKLAGSPGATLSDLFQLIKIEGKWLISQKSFHWHTA
jgi:hypothetical protein